MGLLKSSDEYCTFNYYYDIYGARYVNEYCKTVDIYSGFIFDDVMPPIYNTYNYYAPFDDIISSDDYCTFQYGIFNTTKTCTTTERYINGDIITYTDVYYLP